MLKRPENAARFKLDSLCAAYLDPLDSLLSGKETIFDTAKPTSLDCLALGYVSLMVFPTLHQPWLSDTIKSRYSAVAQYARRHRLTLFGREVLPEAVLSINALAPSDRTHSSIRAARRTLSLDLPWSPLATRSASATAAAVGQELFDSLPGISHLRGWGSSLSTVKPATPIEKRGSETSTVSFPLAVVTLTGFVALAASAAYWQVGPMAGLGSSAEASSQGQNHSEAGALLAALGERLQFDTQDLGSLKPQVKGQVGDGSNAVEVQADVRERTEGLKSTTV
jgi:hypothetical protein